MDLFCSNCIIFSFLRATLRFTFSPETAGLSRDELSQLRSNLGDLFQGIDCAGSDRVCRVGGNAGNAPAGPAEDQGPGQFGATVSSSMAGTSSTKMEAKNGTFHSSLKCKCGIFHCHHVGFRLGWKQVISNMLRVTKYGGDTVNHL